ncbi:hypothetical protein GCM10008012_23890 [Rhizobium anhuiense]|nr:hypothetical protein GCM10008012_23890 [Rhizobium anhuiense]
MDRQPEHGKDQRDADYPRKCRLSQQADGGAVGARGHGASYNVITLRLCYNDCGEIEAGSAQLLTQL